MDTNLNIHSDIINENNIDDNIIYNNNDSVIIIMAGGLGSRMNSTLPKVLHKINDIPMIINILNTSLIIKPYKICIIVGKFKDLIKKTIEEYYIKNNRFNEIVYKLHYIIQKEPLGTGDAIMCCTKYLKKLNINVNRCVILSGDVPFIKTSTINKLLKNEFSSNILIAYNNNPYGYGRIKITNNKFNKIIEEKDCNEEEKMIKLINSGIYFFKINILLKFINLLSNNNNQNEYYLTQIFEIFVNNNIDIGFTLVKDVIEISGVNTQEQLNDLEANYYDFEKINIS